MKRPSADDLVVVGKVGRPHGVRGELRVWPFAADSGALFDVESVFVADSPKGPFGLHRVRSARAADRTVLLTLEEVGHRDAAEALKGKLVLVNKTDLPELTDPDEFYHFQLVGMTVVTAAGESLGVLEEIFDTGAGDVLVVRDRAQDLEVLIPFVAEFVALDEAETGLVVDPPEGLIEATRTPIEAQAKKKSS